MSRHFKVDRMFSDHMVLQRDSLVPIWGKGIEGETVTVCCGDRCVHTVVKGGTWKAELQTTQAGGPYEVIVESGADKVAFKDVWFGDVWLAGGQSNMEWRLKDTKEANDEIRLADYPRIRFYNVPRVSYEDGLEHDASWEVCTPEQAGEFSAVAYYYAKELVRSLDIPIGIVGCNWGGTSASCWVPEEVLAADLELKSYIDEFKDRLDNLTPEERMKDQQRYDEGVAEYNRRQAAGMTGEELGDYPWPPPFNEHTFLRPTGLYGTMIRKTAPYGVKGFIYYQGESDAPKPTLYDKLLSTLIHTWRRDWGNAELPFLFVQLPGHNWDGNPDGEEWPLVRESQLIVTERVPHTGMAVILECGEANDIHPRDKKPVGLRLALVALNSVYGQDVVSSGPVFKEMAVKSGKALISFEHYGEGLAAREGELVGFEIADGDGEFVKAKAIIHGDAVEVWSDEVDKPTAVRYAWANTPEANLVNRRGLPAGPFRTERVGR